MDLNLFDFHLPEHLIAQSPLLERTSSRLLTLNKKTGEFHHRVFSDLEQLLNPGDLLVLNDTRVLPARLIGIKPDTGAKLEVLLLRQEHDDVWRGLVKPAKRAKVGTRIHFGDPENPLLVGEVVGEGEQGERTIRFEYAGVFLECLDKLGEMPLPPYIHERLEDRERYQTVYAKNDGSAAAPTAGLHFTKEFMERLQAKGINIAYVTLHVGLGTFRPVSVDNVHEHKMHEEYYEVSGETIQAIYDTKAAGGRVIAVGTTSCRTLETVALRLGSDTQTIQNSSGVRPQSVSGWTDIFIYPGFELKWVDAMTTNFHLPKSTLMMLISALAGRDNVMAAYEAAIEEQYRFFSFGDAMFIY
ncbi:MAG: tRNA preQ1(34) S-adenosylmethionine ribosyltransferase-isomerase QueA [Bacillota bacterium]|jgi:S-adenosylmethionine:tRNA ribosyltransferase-isomerase